MAQRVDQAATATDDSAQFYAEIADGLHALAQPLTILRSTVEMIGLCRQTGTDSERYIELTVEQMDRACQLFASIQSLMTTRLDPPKTAKIDLLGLLTAMVEEREAASLVLGIGMAAVMPESLAPVHGDAERTRQAITAMLDAALSVSSRGDVIELHASQSNGLVTLTAQSTRKENKRLNAADRLHLALAKADILSQQGQYYFVDEPFFVSLAWLVSPTHQQRVHAALD